MAQGISVLWRFFDENGFRRGFCILSPSRSPDTREPLVKVHTLRRAPLRRLLTIVFVGSAGVAPSARASDGIELEARAAVGVGNMLSTPQRDAGYKTGFVPDLRPALRVSEWVAAELAASSWFFPRDAGGTGRATMLGVGARFDPRLTTWLTWFADAHAGVGLTGANNRFMADGGTGFDFWLTRNLAFGPYLRYAQVVDSGPDPRFWAVGVSATMTLAKGSDEPPNLGRSDPERDERQRAWEQSRQHTPRLRDRDGDGITDDRDICPDEKAGSRPDPNMLGCPLSSSSAAPAAPPVARASGDRDGDGVPDRDDKCPTVPFGNFPDPFAMGCPLADKDGDGIPDINDACPTKAGGADTNPKRNGCPGGGDAPIRRDMVTINRDNIRLARPIAFGTNNENILPGSLPVLGQLADVLKATTALRKVSIEAHTDSSMPALQGIELSERRAEAVKRWLVANGVDEQRLTVRGFGDTRPIASNKTAKGRAANARIELVILDSGLSP
jgi:outer membrane protein OmpA-like peptidoglycan-associated protein